MGSIRFPFLKCDKNKLLSENSRICIPLFHIVNLGVCTLLVVEFYFCIFRIIFAQRPYAIVLACYADSYMRFTHLLTEKTVSREIR